MVLFIAAFISVFGVAEYSDYFIHRKQYIFMQQLYHDLKWARMESIALNISVVIQPYDGARNILVTDWCQGWVIYRNPEKQGLKSASQILKIQEASPVNCDITYSSSLGLPYFQFSPLGNSNYQNGHFYFYQDAKLTMSIVINQVGRVRWESA